MKKFSLCLQCTFPDPQKKQDPQKPLQHLSNRHGELRAGVYTQYGSSLQLHVSYSTWLVYRWILLMSVAMHGPPTSSQWSEHGLLYSLTLYNFQHLTQGGTAGVVLQRFN